MGRLLIRKKDLVQVLGPLGIILFVALFFLLVEMFLPFTSKNASVYPAYLYYTLFYVVFAFSYLSVSLGLRAGTGFIRVCPEKINYDLYRVMRFSCLVSLVGIVFIIVDRTQYQGVNFLESNFVEIRAKLNSERSAVSGVSSIYSVLGNLFQIWYFFALALLIYYYEFIARKQRFLLWIMIVPLVMMGSYILGGRSLIGLAFLTAFSAIAARSTSGRVGLSLFFKPKSLIFFLVMFILFVTALMYVFYARATVGGNSSSSYLMDFVLHLHGEVTPSYKRCDAGTFCDFINYLQLTALYVVHTFWVFAESIQYTGADVGGYPLFGGVVLLLDKIMPGVNETNYMFAGLFNSLPGSVYYQYGELGLLVVGMLLGCVLAVLAFVVSRGLGVLRVLLYMAIFSALVVSPVISILNMVMYVFILAACFVAVFLYWLIRSFKSRKNLLCV